LPFGILNIKQSSPSSRAFLVFTSSSIDSALATLAILASEHSGCPRECCPFVDDAVLMALLMALLFRCLQFVIRVQPVGILVGCCATFRDSKPASMRQLMTNFLAE
jgi:hypothetical protein